MSKTTVEHIAHYEDVSSDRSASAEKGRLSGPASSSEFDNIDGKAVIRKIDWRLLPLLTALYTMTFLDRVNIGNAVLWGMEKQLGMTGYDYNIVVLGEFRQTTSH
jgi:hypothetical protein